MNTRVKHLALFISFSAACLSSPYSASAADSSNDSNANQAERARPVRDKTPPVLTLLGESTMSIMQGGSFSDPGASAIDNIDGEVPVRVFGTIRRYVPGDYTLTYSARDASRNEARATRTVRVVADTTPPVITLNGDSTLTVTQGTTFNDPGATATDDISGTVTVSTFGRVNTRRLGSYTLSYRARDRAGNSSTLTRTVNVIAAAPIDTIAPVITLNGAASLEITVGDTYTDAGASATDNVDGTVAVITTGSVDTSTAGSYTLTYTATDTTGNTASLTRTITVKPLPNQAPSANAGADQTVNEEATVSLSGSGSDTDGTIASYAWVQTSGTTVMINNADQAQASFTAPAVEADDSLSFKLTVTDDDGATAESTTTIIVKNLDTTPPVISLNGEANLELTVGDTYTEAGATATDNVDGPVTVNTTGAVDTSTAGTYTITYTATDAAGNTATLIRSITVKPLPNQAPTADAGVDQTVNEQTTVTLNGSNSSDPDGSITNYHWEQTAGDIVSLNNADQAQATFQAPEVSTDTSLSFKLTVTDNQGSTAEKTTTVLVKAVDSTKPVITLQGSNPVTINVGTTYTDAGATATDDVDGSVTVNTTGSVDTSAVGSYTITYTATDTAGNTATLTRTVIVQVASSTIYGMNDTGVTSCGDATANDKLCPIASYPNQDAQMGRDFTNNDPSDGIAGFSFTKLDANGQALADQTAAYSVTPWSCVRDNVTGLTWEVKTNDNGLHDKDWTYRWYDVRYPDPSIPPNTTPTLGNCDSGLACLTGAFVNRTNASNFCGHNDWRMPTTNELFGLFALEQNKSLDLAYFPDSTTDTRYWAIESLARDISSAWYVSTDVINYSHINYGKKSQILHVRLVRSPTTGN